MLADLGVAREGVAVSGKRATWNETALTQLPVTSVLAVTARVPVGIAPGDPNGLVDPNAAPLRFDPRFDELNRTPGLDPEARRHRGRRDREEPASPMRLRSTDRPGHKPSNPFDAHPRGASSAPSSYGGLL
jgi:hypothetical protein